MAQATKVSARLGIARRPTVYLAGPIGGKTYHESERWRDQAKYHLEALGIDGFSPLRDQDFLRAHGVLTTAPYDSSPLTTAKGIVTRDFRDCTTCDLVLANVLNAQQHSLGTVMEIAWAYAARVPCVLVAEPDNIHHHAMVDYCSGYIAESLDQALLIVASLLLP